MSIGIGRPRVYTSAQRARILRAIQRTGSMKGAQRALADHKSSLEVSMAVIQSVAKENGLKFKRGRNAVSLKAKRGRPVAA